MPKRIKHRKQSRGVNQAAHVHARQTTANIEPVSPNASVVPAIISEYMASIGRKGGKIGGKRRLSTLSGEERKAIASAAAKARWRKKRRAED